MRWNHVTTPSFFAKIKERIARALYLSLMSWLIRSCACLFLLSTDTRRVFSCVFVTLWIRGDSHVALWRKKKKSPDLLQPIIRLTSLLSPLLLLLSFTRNAASLRRELVTNIHTQNPILPVMLCKRDLEEGRLVDSADADADRCYFPPAFPQKPACYWLVVGARAQTSTWAQSTSQSRRWTSDALN